MQEGAPSFQLPVESGSPSNRVSAWVEFLPNRFPSSTITHRPSELTKVLKKQSLTRAQLAKSSQKAIPLPKRSDKLIELSKQKTIETTPNKHVEPLKNTEPRADQTATSILTNSGDIRTSLGFFKPFESDKSFEEQESVDGQVISETMKRKFPEQVIEENLEDNIDEEDKQYLKQRKEKHPKKSDRQIPNLK